MTPVAPGRPVAPGLSKAVPRSRTYELLRSAFLYPDDAAYTRLADGAWISDLQAAAAALPYGAPSLDGLGDVPESLEAAQVEFSRLFDVGPGGPPCSLFGGHYEADRLRVMEEAVRFYEFFGLRFERETGLFPDHICVQMEFVEHLAAAQSSAADEASYLRAQRDFLERHLCRWLPRLVDSVQRQAELPFYRNLVAWTAALLDADRRYLVAKLRQTAG